MFDKRTFEPLGGFGKIGRGPNEYINPTRIKVNKSLGLISFLQSPVCRIVGVRLNEIIRNVEPTPLISFQISQKLMPVASGYYILDNKKLLLSTTTDSSLFTLIDNNSNIIKTFGSLKTKEKNLTTFSTNGFYKHSFVHNSGKNIIVSGYQYFDLLQKLDLNNGIVNSLYGKNYKVNKPQVAESGDILNNYLAFYNFKNDNHYVYASFLGNPFFNIKDLTSNYATDLLVFDWDLKPIARLKFLHSIVDFDIDDDKIYVLSSDLENPLMVFTFDKKNLALK